MDSQRLRSAQIIMKGAKDVHRRLDLVLNVMMDTSDMVTTINSNALDVIRFQER